MNLNPNVLELAQHCLLAEQQADSIRVYLAEPSLHTSARGSEFEQALQTHYQTSIKLSIDVAPLTAEQCAQSPASIKQAQWQQREQIARENLKKMPLFQALSQCFSVQMGALYLQKLD